MGRHTTGGACPPTLAARWALLASTLEDDLWHTASTVSRRVPQLTTGQRKQVLDNARQRGWIERERIPDDEIREEKVRGGTSCSRWRYRVTPSGRAAAEATHV